MLYCIYCIQTVVIPLVVVCACMCVWCVCVCGGCAFVHAYLRSREESRQTASCVMHERRWLLFISKRNIKL